MTDADEELRSGGAWRPAVWWPAATLLIGGLAGYLIGTGHFRPPPGAPSSAASVTSVRSTSAPTPTLASSLLEATYARCSAQSGRRLQLGVELVNLGAAAVTVREVTPLFPLGGLRPVRTALGTCGQLPSGTPRDFEVAAHSTEWITATVEVQRGCPAPLPVRFAVRYTSAGRAGSTVLNAFSDLGDVPYSGCPS